MSENELPPNRLGEENSKAILPLIEPLAQEISEAVSSFVARMKKKDDDFDNDNIGILASMAISSLMGFMMVRTAGGDGPRLKTLQENFFTAVREMCDLHQES